ncbi:MAG: ydiI [Proteobacteria bacterium]|nr:ydiI [Pseudomonadota bacterium]
MTQEAKAIWFRPPTVAELNATRPGTMMEHLGIEYTACGPDSLEARMPVDARTRQPYGLLHGGASLVLAETLGSYGAALTVDPARLLVVGQEINANHLRPVKHGYVTGTARPIQLGSRSQVWSVEIRDDRGRLVCVSRLTIAVLERGARPGPP